MKHFRPLRAVWLAAALIGLAAPVFAHGDSRTSQHHSNLPTEQTDWGIAGSAGKISRSIAIRMTDDMRFTPDTLQIRQGETIRFTISNAGRRLHEMVIGTPEAIAEHAALMKRFPKMEHAEAHMSHVRAGQQGEIIWHFNRVGKFEFACLVGNHYDKGMRGSIEVKP
jgi:uncharacterized cupredoxin-like copper-binding protein